MAGARADIAAIRAEVVELRTRVASLEALMGTGSLRLAQDAPEADGAGFVRLKQAAGVLGLSVEGARQRAMRLVPLGLAVKRRPGGWRVSLATLSNKETKRP